jgi:hypothetical protein
MALDTQTVAEVLAAFKSDSNSSLISNLDATDPLVQRAKKIEQLFTSGVDMFRRVSNPILSDLMSYVWDIYHHRHVLTAIGPNVPSVSIAVLRKPGGGYQAMTFLPPNWLDLIEENSLLQLGGIVFVSSQVTDYYNGKLTNPIDGAISAKRATAYEAEYLRMLKGSSLTSYQRGVLDQFPDDFDPTFVYARKPVVATN